MIASEDDQPLPLPVPDSRPTPDTLAREALTILLDSGQFSRLVLLLVALGYHSQARELLALQATILAALTTPRRKPRA